MNRTLIACATAMILSFAGCNQAPAPAANTSTSSHDAGVQAIKDNETQWNQDFAAKDAAKLTGHYTSDAVLMIPGHDPLVGIDAIGKDVQEMVKDPALSIKFQSSKVDVASSGDLAYTRGTYTMTMTDPKTKKPVTDHGSYVTDYRKQPDGSWKAVADIITSEVPMEPPASVKKK